MKNKTDRTVPQETVLIESRLRGLETRVHDLKERCLQLERFARVVGGEFAKTHLSEHQADAWAKNANSLDNAMREINGHLKRFGNEFDKPPYIPTEQD